MTYATTPLERFGGLNLRAAVDAVGPAEALDALNVEYTDRSAVKSRAGYGLFTAAALTNRPQSLHAHYRAAGTPQLLAGCGTRLEALSNTGAPVASQTALGDGIWDFARFGTPNAEVSYAGNGFAHASNSGLVSWNGTAWAIVGNTPAASALAVMARSNRLVAGGFNTTTGGPVGGAGSSSPSHVYFSDPGLAETWTASNFIQLTPGDGERVQAVIAWREFVFIFKESKFFVVYGETPDGSGGVEFQYYAVDTGVGTINSKTVAVHESGVYFLHGSGLYRTTGNEPEYLSVPVEPAFRQESKAFYLGNDVQISGAEAVGVWDNRVYTAFGDDGGANSQTFVHDILAEWWTLFDFPATCFATFEGSTNREELVFGRASGSNVVQAHEGGGFSATDAVGPFAFENVTSRWRGGFANYGTLDVKTFRETKVVGNGSVNISLSTDGATAPGTTAVLDMSDGSHELVARMHRVAYRGRDFSVYLSNEGTWWSVHQVVHHIREQGIPSRTAGKVIA